MINLFIIVIFLGRLRLKHFTLAVTIKITGATRIESVMYLYIFFILFLFSINDLLSKGNVLVKGNEWTKIDKTWINVTMIFVVILSCSFLKKSKFFK